MPPAYVALLNSGELGRRVARARAGLTDCVLCARYCHVNRLAGTRGAVCRTGARAVVYSHGPHHGEEAPVSGSQGSGTIFFSWCSLRCEFCQNWEISRRGAGHEMDAEELARTMLALQAQGCHNINFVTPSHVVAQILEAVLLAAERGLTVPLVYNSSGYDSLEALRLLDGVIDIYMPDMKYGDSALARKFSHVPDYWEVNRVAVAEMHRQVGDLLVDCQGIAQQGLLVRHLVLPGEVAGTESVMRFLAERISCNTYLNIMDQYRPCYRAGDLPPLDRPTSHEEYRRALAAARRAGLQRLDERRARWILQ